MDQEITHLIRRAANLIVEFVVQYSFQVLGGLIILFIGWRLGQWAATLVVKFGNRKKYDLALTNFIASLLRGVVLVFALIMALEKFGVTITPLVAAASALLFGGSFALQGTLSNYAAGLSIMFARPFTIGDIIEVAGQSGMVQDVKLPVTILTNADGQRVTVPNKQIIGQVIRNSFSNGMIDVRIGISYADDPERAIAVIEGVLAKFPQIVQVPAPQIGIKEFGDSAIHIQIRYWVPAQQYVPTLYGVNLAVYRALKQAGITIPFPQREVRLLQ